MHLKRNSCVSKGRLNNKWREAWRRIDNKLQRRQCEEGEEQGDMKRTTGFKQVLTHNVERSGWRRWDCQRFDTGTGGRLTVTDVFTVSFLLHTVNHSEGLPLLLYCILVFIHTFLIICVSFNISICSFAIFADHYLHYFLCDLPVFPPLSHLNDITRKPTKGRQGYKVMKALW